MFHLLNFTLLKTAIWHSYYSLKYIPRFHDKKIKITVVGAIEM